MRSGLIAVILWSLAVWPAACTSPAAPVPPAAPPAQPTAAPEPKTRTAADGTSSQGEASSDDSEKGSDFWLKLRDRTDDSAQGLPYRMLVYTLLILVLGGVGLFLVKKVLPKINSRAGRSVRVLETVYLGPKKTLHLLQVGSQRFLVAGSREQICLLGEVTSAFPQQDDAAAPAAAAAFASVLKKSQDGSDSDAEKL